MINLTDFLEEKKKKFSYNYFRLKELINDGLDKKNIANFCSLLRQMQLTNVSINSCIKIALPNQYIFLKKEFAKFNYEAMIFENKLLVNPKPWFPNKAVCGCSRNRLYEE